MAAAKDRINVSHVHTEHISIQINKKAEYTVWKNELHDISHHKLVFMTVFRTSVH